MKNDLTLGLVVLGCLATAPAFADDPRKGQPPKAQPPDAAGKRAAPASPDKDAAPTPDPRYEVTAPIRNQDQDTDLSIGQTETTAAAPRTDAQGRPDVIESRPEKRREVDEQRLAIAPVFGFGSRDLNVGIGARAGYTFRGAPIYVGGNFVYHFGDSVSVPGGGEATTRFYYPSAEVGYDLGIGPMLLRPYVGLGALLGSGSTSGGAPTSAIPRTTETAALAYPGVTVHYLIPDTPGFVGADGRVLVPTEGNAAVAAYLTGGLNL